MIAQLNGRPDGPTPAPTWESVRGLARAAEEVGFDSFVFEDALLYRGPQSTNGCWESMSIAAALAVATERIEFGQSVINAPYRSAAMIAKMAETIDEISGGRYLFGIGAGNTEDSDYEAFGFPTDARYSRFAEAIQIIHALLKTGAVDFDGEYHSARQAELVLRGPRPTGPPIIIAASGPKMMRLTARYGDVWNWWCADPGDSGPLVPLIERLNGACGEEGRDPASLGRTVDLYTVDPMGRVETEEAKVPGSPLVGSPEEIAEAILGFQSLGFDEARCNLYPRTVDAVEAMAPVVELVQAG
ncbi:MAG TPA: LLM class flavin-dependent oxidoreductase [Acidimicrobiia bacterium]|nr:LLM class flavin-dependent oxidoreductase [Acidimicrobiia bacterium]